MANEFIDWAAGAEYICQGVSWATGQPSLEVVEAGGGMGKLVKLIDRKLGFRLVSEERFCVGRYGFVNETGIEHVVCPYRAAVSSGDQCRECAARDEFRFAHHVHRGGYTPASLTRYMAQPHWIYVATFADASSKVGTASAVRKKSRLDEQGAVRATYVVRTPDGMVARVFEDAITNALGLSQTKRRSAKVASLATPASLDAITASHQRDVEQAISSVSSGCDVQGVTFPKEWWKPPVEIAPFFESLPTGGWPVYPHDIRAGDHGFNIAACAGSVALARLEEDITATRYVVDLGALKGRRVVAGAFSSPVSSFQSSLF